MRIAFILPSEIERQRIGAAREVMLEMRHDQIAHVLHLLRSWEVFGTRDGVSMTWRAIKRALRDRP